MDDKKYTLSMLVEDEPGVLSRISGLFSRRGFNIQSLAVGGSETKGLSRITLVMVGDDRTIEQLMKQLYKLVNVLDVQNLTEVPSLEREIMLIKITKTKETQSEILEIAKLFNIKILDFTEYSTIMEISGDPPKMVAIEKILSKFGILKLSRAGRIALKRDPLI